MLFSRHFKIFESSLLLFALVSPISSYSVGSSSLKVIYVAFIFVLIGLLNYKGNFKPISIHAEVILYIFLFSSIYAFLIGLFFIGGYMGFTEFVGIIFSLILIIILNRTVHNLHILNLFLKALFITNILSDLIVFYYLLRGNPIIFRLSKDGIRLVGFYSNANFLAASHLLLIPYALYLIVNSKRKNTKLIYLFSLFVLISVLIMAQSRSAFIGLIISFLILIFRFHFLKIKHIFKVKYVLILGIFLFSFIFTFLFIINKYDIKLARFQSNPSAGSVSVYDINGAYIKKDREYLLYNGLQAILNYPLGLGYSEQYKVMGNLTGIYKISHNANIQLIVTYGIFFGLFWNFILIYLFYYSDKFIRKKRLTLHNLSPYLLWGYMSYSVYNLGHDSSNWVYFWIYSFLLFITVKLEYSESLPIEQ